uniref:Uncharacterized protein n=1 Tax=Sphaerodactylus townsendi TaxID=933632 RepID=A0ACB8EPA4_9SAUR
MKQLSYSQASQCAGETKYLPESQRGPCPALGQKPLAGEMLEPDAASEGDDSAELRAVTLGSDERKPQPDSDVTMGVDGMESGQCQQHQQYPGPKCPNYPARRPQVMEDKALSGSNSQCYNPGMAPRPPGGPKPLSRQSSLSYQGSPSYEASGNASPRRMMRLPPLHGPEEACYVQLGKAAGHKLMGPHQRHHPPPSCVAEDPGGPYPPGLEGLKSDSFSYLPEEQVSNSLDTLDLENTRGLPRPSRMRLRVPVGSPVLCHDLTSTRWELRGIVSQDVTNCTSPVLASQIAPHLEWLWQQRILKNPFPSTPGHTETTTSTIPTLAKEQSSSTAPRLLMSAAGPFIAAGPHFPVPTTPILVPHTHMTMEPCEMAWNSTSQTYQLNKMADLMDHKIGSCLRPGFAPRRPSCSEAEVGEFPWVVSLRLSIQRFCSGSILNSWWILTSTANCGYLIKNSEALVLVPAGPVDTLEGTGSVPERQVLRGPSRLLRRPVTILNISSCNGLEETLPEAIFCIKAQKDKEGLCKVTGTKVSF